MGIIHNIRQIFAASEIPIGGKIFVNNTEEFDKDLKYDYKTIDDLMQDERVYAIVSLVSAMVQNAYVGPNIRPKNKYLDDKLSDKEEKAIEIADQFAIDIEMKSKFFEYTWQLVSHGDMFEKIIKTKDGITDLESLPLNSTRAINNEKQAKQQNVEEQILKETMIAVQKNKNDNNPRIYRLDKKEYFHLSYKKHAVWKKDSANADTYNIYSLSPLATLQRLVSWKKKTIENDILWKNKLLPRLLYKLKMPSIVPSKYIGTQEEKVAAAQKDALKITNDFINSTKRLRPDDDIVISDAVEASMLEAHSTNYARPNDTISQINTLLNTTQGIPTGLLGGDVGASLGVEISAIFAGIRVDYIARIIANQFNKLMQSHITIVNSGIGEEVIKRMFIHIDPSLTVEKFEKVKTAITMSSSGAFTKGEIREATGYPRLPQLPTEAFPTIDSQDNSKTTVRQIEKNIKQEEPNSRMNNRSPKAQRNTTQGDPSRTNV